MKKIQATLILILITIYTASSIQTVNFICQTVDVTLCQSGYRYRTFGVYQTIYLNSTYCMPVGKTCKPANKQFNIQSCKLDYKNQECSTGLCYMYPSKPVCQLNTTCGSAASPSNYFSNYTCDNCNNNQSNCSKCFFQTTNRTNSTTRTISTCLGAICTQGLSTAHTSVARCPNRFDELGQECQCCVTTLQISRFCTSNSPALAAKEVNQWYNKVSENYLSNLTVITILLLIILSIIF